MNINTALEKYNIKENDLEGSWNKTQEHNKADNICGTREIEKAKSRLV